VEIWAFDPVHGARKLRTFHENTCTATTTMISNTNQEEDDTGGFRSSRNSVIRLSYYGGGHYDSIVHLYQPSHNAIQIPGQNEEMMIETRRLERLIANNQTSRPGSESSTYTATIAASDRERQEQEQLALRRAIDESRKNYLIQEQTNDDIETALLISLKDNPILSLDESNGVASTGGANVVITDEEAILQSVAMESERDYLETALLTSILEHPVDEKLIGNEPPTVEDQIRMIEEDLQAESNAPNACTTNSAMDVEGTAQAKSTTETTVQPSESKENRVASAPAEDEQLKLVQELSTMTDEEIYQLAIQQSLQTPVTPASNTSNVVSSTPSRTTTTTSNVPARTNQAEFDALSEEEMIRIAMEASLQQYSNPPNPMQSRNNFGYEEEYDEELMLAIQASLQR
jgi:hypothetical protein